MNTLAITKTTRTPHPQHPYDKIKNDILGKNYELSLVFVGKNKARTLNQETRSKSYIPNVLSFPLSKNLGEIFICPSTAETEAKKFNLSKKNYVAYLFIHGCLHLKGLKHGHKMDVLEQKYLKKYGLE